MCAKEREQSGSATRQASSSSRNSRTGDSWFPREGECCGRRRACSRRVAVPDGGGAEPGRRERGERGATCRATRGHRRSCTPPSRGLARSCLGRGVGGRRRPDLYRRRSDRTPSSSTHRSRARLPGTPPRRRAPPPRPPVGSALQGSVGVRRSSSRCGAPTRRPLLRLMPPLLCSCPHAGLGRPKKVADTANMNPRRSCRCAVAGRRRQRRARARGETAAGRPRRSRSTRGSRRRSRDGGSRGGASSTREGGNKRGGGAGEGRRGREQGVAHPGDDRRGWSWRSRRSGGWRRWRLR